MDTKVIFLQRLWQSFAGAITLALVPHFLTPEEQGYFYVMASLAALYVFFDMGLSTILVQFSAREVAIIDRSSLDSHLDRYRERFSSLVRKASLWYLTSSFVFLFVAPFGWFFLQGGVNHGSTLNWQLPWALLVFFTALNLISLPFLSISEGAGAISEVYTIRLIQGLVGASCLWLALAASSGLIAIAMPMIVSSTVGLVWVLKCRRAMLTCALAYQSTGLCWRKELLPLQWRTLSSTLAGYTLVTINAPLLFWAQGPVIAGQMGLTITIINMLTLLAMSWYTARVPHMVELVVKRDWAELEACFNSALVRSLFFYVTASIALLIMQHIANQTGYETRLLPMSETFILTLAMGFYLLMNLYVGYLRLYMAEPFFRVSLLGALLVVACSISVAPQHSSLGVAIVLLAVNGFFLLPAAIYMRFKLAKQWQK